jgi:hypothetical protein
VGEKSNRWQALSRILILLEGETEYEFVSKVLAPYLLTKFIYLVPTVVETKKNIGGTSHKGGGDFSKIKADILSLLHDSNAVAVTTFYDFYGFPEIPNTDAGIYKDIVKLEEAIASQFNSCRFKPYLQMHEFEAFLFVESELTARVALKQQHTVSIQQHRNQFNHVEEINLGKGTAPSKRLIATIGKYNKPRIGGKVTQELGVSRLMQECPKFSSWVSWMLSFSPENNRE